MKKRVALKTIKGFTLIEVIIYVAIIGVVVSSFISLSISLTNTRNKTYVIQEVQANSRIVKEMIGREIKEANQVLAPIQGDSGSALELDLPLTANNVVYSLSNGVLYRQFGTLDPVAITSDEIEVSSINFSNNSITGGKDSVAYELTVDYRNADSSFFDYSEDIRGSACVRQ